MRLQARGKRARVPQQRHRASASRVSMRPRRRRRQVRCRRRCSMRFGRRKRGQLSKGMPPWAGQLATSASRAQPLEAGPLRTWPR